MYQLPKYEKATILLYNQGNDPIYIDVYASNLQRRLVDYAVKYPDICKQTDKDKYL